MKTIKMLVYVLLVIATLGIAFVTSGGCTETEEPDTFKKLLKLIPADGSVNENFITISDYAAIFEDVGISLSELDEQSVTFQGLLDLIEDKEINISDKPLIFHYFVTGWSQYSTSEIITDNNVGYNFASLDAGIMAGFPPNEMVAAIGRYDPSATRDALQNQDEWPSWAVDAYSTEEYHGVTIHTWGDGHETHLMDALVSPHIDMLGRAAPLAVTDGFMFSSTSLENVKAMIDASQGKAESLADLPEYVDIAVKMSELGVYTVLLGDESLVNGILEQSGTYAGPRLNKFLTFGSASGTDENGAFMALILYHDSPEDAEANVAILKERIGKTAFNEEQSWDKMVSDTYIQAEGKLVVAKLYMENVNIWASWVYNDEPLLLHEK